MPLSILENVTGDEIGPEFVAHWYEPSLNVRGVMVVDNSALGMATGGTRMAPDITTREIADLARAMTYKKATLGVPVGGAKAGIWADPAIKGTERERILRAFGRVLRPLFQANIVRYNPDMGISARDVAIIGEEAGYPPARSDFSQEFRDGEPLENHFTGFGVAVAAEAACEVVGRQVSGLTAAIEGFGKVGGGAVRYLAKKGVRVIALSTLLGAVYEESGLDVEELFKLRAAYGDECVLRYEKGRQIPKENLYTLPVDILVPGGRPYVISESNAHRIAASIIASGANIPVTDGALESLNQRGVLVVPDFISNSGGTLSGMSRRIGLSPDEIFTAIEKLVGANTREVLLASQETGISPTRVARERALEKIRSAKEKGHRAGPDEALAALRQLIEAA